MKTVPTPSIAALFGAVALFGAASANPPLPVSGITAKSSKTSSRPSSSDSSLKDTYEVWASDQSNSVAGVEVSGVKGSLLWIWSSDSIRRQIAGGEDAMPLSCSPQKDAGPCNLLDIFPADLVDGNGTRIGDLSAFGRLHGLIKDSFNRYVTANLYAPGGGYVGVIDTRSKEAIGLFRVTGTGGTATARSVHMSFWTADGSGILISNLEGKMIERIDVTRDSTGNIINLKFNKSAGVYLGADWKLISEATHFSGSNAVGKPLIGSVVGTYGDADIGNLTPAGKLKEWKCPQNVTVPSNVIPEGGCRPNNTPICPLPSSNNNAYVSLGGGGLFVLKIDTTPMKIIGEYGDRVINGAGCGGVEAQGKFFINGGVSASSSGSTQSTFTVYSFDDSRFDPNVGPAENTPMPTLVFKDSTNTNTLGNIDGKSVSNDSGQLPAFTTRRDSHGVGVTLDGKYLHMSDRIQNVVEVFDAKTQNRVNTYDLVSKDGKSGRQGPSAACFSRSVLDDKDLQLNDPAPDLFELTPDGKYFMWAFRGPKPITLTHTAQGSCPGVGIVELFEDGKAGRLVDVLRTTNKVDNSTVGIIPGGVNYTGAERSDVHAAIVVARD